jgi:hypothetical protein
MIPHGPKLKQVPASLQDHAFWPDNMCCSNYTRTFAQVHLLFQLTATTTHIPVYVENQVSGRKMMILERELK